MPFVLMDFPLMRRERMEELKAIAEQAGAPNVSPARDPSLLFKPRTIAGHQLSAPLAGSSAGMRRSGFLTRSIGVIRSRLLRTSDQSRSNRGLPLSKICEYCMQIKVELARKLLPYSSHFRNDRVFAHGIILP